MGGGKLSFLLVSEETERESFTFSIFALLFHFFSKPLSKLNKKNMRYISRHIAMNSLSYINSLQK